MLRKLVNSPTHTGNDEPTEEFYVEEIKEEKIGAVSEVELPCHYSKYVLPSNRFTRRLGAV